MARKGGAIIRWPLQPNQIAEAINVSLPSDERALLEMDLTQYGIYPVPEATPPTPLPGHKVTLAEPIWEEGVLKRAFNQVPVTEDQLDRAWAALRQERNKRLRDTDWSQIVADIDPAAKEAFAIYRQALRDMTEAPDVNPLAPVWPVHPDDQQ